jgi:hypothetical protein
MLDRLNARDGTDNVARTEPLLRQAFDRALDLRRGRHQLDGDVRLLLVDACRVARAEQMPPEQVIVVLKRWWTTAHDAVGSNRLDAQPALNDLVTACIEAYFDDPDTPHV